MADAPDPQGTPISQVSQMPIAAPRPRDWRGPLRALSILLAVAVVIVAGLAIHARLNPGPINDPVRGQQILAKAEAAALQDTAFIASGKVGADLGAGSNFTTPLTGHGEETHQPQRVHLVLSAQSPLGGSLDVEVIEDGTTYYTKTAGLGATAGKPWTKTDSASSGIGGIAFTQFLDYRYIQHPVYVGYETIAGHATYHIHADLSSQISGTVATATPAGTSAQVTEELWFSKSSYFPIQITLHAGASGQASSSLVSATVDETFTFTSWNTGLTIILPPPDQVQ